MTATGAAAATGRDRADRLRLLGAVVGDVGAVATLRVEEMHNAVADRVFGAVGPAADPWRSVHDRIAANTYGAIRIGQRALGRLTGAVAALTPLRDDPRLEGRMAGMLHGAVSGAFGDHLEQRHPRLAIPMSVRHDGRDVSVTDGAALRAAFPRPGRRLAVFLHGLCETEEWWGTPALDDTAPGTYGDHLNRRLGHTAVFVRYNTGLHVSENGRRLADLLTSLIEMWPQPVDSLTLIGHSMGGLVIRSACACAEKARQPWVARVDHCVYVGTPHDGAWLEQGANLAASALRAVPETRPIARLLDARSAGVKDLRFGYVRDEDWLGHDSDALLADTGTDVPLLATARHHMIAATLGETPRHILSRMFGDALVHPSSAFGRGRRGRSLQIDDNHARHLGGVHHAALLRHPLVAAYLEEWLRPTTP